MTRPGFTEHGLQFVWDPTSLSSLMKCQRRYQYEILEGWRLSEESHHLEFGRFLHFADEAIATALSIGWEADEALLTGLAILLFDTFDEATGKYWDSEDKYKNIKNLFRSVIWGFDEVATRLPTVTVNGKPAVELMVTKEIGLAAKSSQAFALTAKLDRIATDGFGAWIVEKKTTKNSIDDNYFGRFAPNVQISQQAALARDLLVDGGLRIQGVMIEARQVSVWQITKPPTPGVKRKPRELPYEGHNFARAATQPIKIGADRSHEWLTVTVPTWLAVAEKCHRENLWPMNETACDFCPFKKVCNKPPELRAGFLKSNFVQVLWDPTRGERLDIVAAS